MLARNTLRQLYSKSVPSVAIRGAASDSKIPYTERQEKLGRPVSPHVTIYKFPLGALTSITNRVTGVALSVGLYLIY